jgi:hypothetical protein
MNPIPSDKNAVSRSPRPAARIVLIALLVLAGILALHYARKKADTAARAASAASKVAYRNRAIVRRAPTVAEAAEDLPSILGTVYDTDGGTLAGAKITATTFDVAGNIPSTAATAVTDREGRFEIALHEGSYQLNAEKDGYAPSSAAADTGNTVSIVMARSGAVHGKVMDADGRPVQRFTLDVLSMVQGNAPAQAPIWSRTIESADGSYRVADMPYWPVVLRATAVDRAPGISPPVAVKAGGEREVDITLSAGCAVAGTVQDGTGKPLGRVLVNAEERLTSGSMADPAIQAQTQVESADDGTFRIDHVPQGNIVVRGYDGEHAVSTATLTISDCEKLTPVTLTMSDGGSVTGFAREADGTPLTGVRLQLIDRSVGIVNTVSDATGRFRFDRLPPGNERLTLEHEGRSIMRIVGVKEGQTVEQDMTLYPDGEGEIRGHVVAGQRPIAGARLVAASNRGHTAGMTFYYAVTDEDGSFRVPSIAKGPYLVSVMSTAVGAGVQVEEGKVANLDLDVSKVRDFGDPSAPPAGQPPVGALRHAPRPPAPVDEPAPTPSP